MSFDILQIGPGADIGRLEAPWKELQEAGGVSHPMYSWEWMSIWWETFGHERSLLALVSREGGQVVTIGAFVRRRARMNRLFSFSRLELMATGEDECDEVFSEYVDLPTRPGSFPEASYRLADELLGLRGDNEWEDLVLHRVQPDSIVCRAFRRSAEKRGLSFSYLLANRSPYVNLPRSPAEYARELSSNRRQQIRRGIRALERMGKVFFEKAATVEDALSTLKLLAKLHQRYWRKRGKPGVFSSARFCRFHKQFIQRTFSLGWPELWTLRVGAETVACLYNLRLQGKVSFYQSGIRLFDDNRIRPGMIAHYLAIEEAIETGAKQYDFLLGESRYKVSLSNAERELVTVRISKPSLKETVRRACEAAARRVRNVILVHRDGRTR